jgi:hypothetical protein
VTPDWTRNLRFAVLIMLFVVSSCNASAAMAPPRSVKYAVSASDVVAIMKIESVKTRDDRAFATGIVLQSLKGTEKGARLRIESETTRAETARYERGDECLVFLGRRRDHYDTPLGMFGKYEIREGKVLRWIMGRTRPETTPLKSVIAEIVKAMGED